LRIILVDEKGVCFSCVLHWKFYVF
jgi:hypothetical protein